MSTKQDSALPRAGEPDPSFGIVVPNDDGTLLPLSLQLPLPDGGFIFGSHVGTAALLVRVLPDGSRDRSFGEDGGASIEFTDRTLVINSLDDVFALPDGGYIARLEVRRRQQDGGFFVFPALARFTSDGKKDLTFGDGGSRAYELPPEPPGFPGLTHQLLKLLSTVASGQDGRGARQNKFWTDAYGDLHILENGQFLLLGTVYEFYYERSHRAYVIKLNANGDYDTTFNEKGYMEPERNVWFAPLRMIPQGDKFLISCSTFGTCAIARFHQNGLLDRTFGDNGYFVDFGKFAYAFFYRLLPTATGDIVCVGRSLFNGPWERNALFICKIDADGRRVMSFNEGQTVTLEPTGQSDAVELWCFDAMLDDEERVVMCGRQLEDYVVNRLTAFLARVLNDGTPDTTLSPNGVLYYPEFQSLDRLSQAPGGDYYAITMSRESNNYFLGRYFG